MNDLLNKLYLTKRYAIILGVILLGFLIWFFGVHQSRIAQLARVDATLSTVQNQIAQARAVIGDVEDVEAQIKSLEEMKNTLTGSIRKQEEISQLVDKIISVGEESEVNFTSINLEADKLFSSRNRNSEYVTVTVNLAMQAKYLEYGQFLERLNKLPFILSVEQVVMNYKKEIYPDLDLQNRLLLVLK